MTARTSKNSHQPLEMALSFLEDDAWRTLDELACATGSDRDSLMAQLISQNSRGRVLMVHASRRRTTVLYHRVTAETQKLAEELCPTDVMDLPWTLKSTVAQKIDALWKKRVIEEPLPGWMTALIVMEGRLQGMNLCEVRPRPEEGMLYPCSWEADYDCGRLSLAMNRGQYRFNIAFTATCRAVPGGDGSTAGGISEMGQWFSASSEMTTLVLDNIGECVVDMCTRKAVSCPSRRKIVAETKRQLREAATLHEQLLPFLPIEPFGFELLSGNKPRGLLGKWLKTGQSVADLVVSTIDSAANGRWRMTR